MPLTPALSHREREVPAPELSPRSICPLSRREREVPAPELSPRSICPLSRRERVRVRGTLYARFVYSGSQIVSRNPPSGLSSAFTQPRCC